MMVSFYDRLETAERIEQIAAVLYGYLAERFASHAEGGTLFRNLQAEEIQHGLRIQLLTNQYRAQPKAFDAIYFDDAALMRAELVAQDTRAGFEQGRYPSDYEEACRLVAELEELFALAHTSMILRDAPATMRHVFELLARQDKAHARLEVIRDSLPPPPPSSRR